VVVINWEQFRALSGKVVNTLSRFCPIPFTSYRAWLLLPVLLGGGVSPAAADPLWTYLGLGGEQVHALETAGGLLLAGTDHGVFSRQLSAVDTFWTPTPLDSVEVLSLLSLDVSTLVASAIEDSAGFTRYRMYRSTDQGASWVQLSIPPLNNAYRFLLDGHPLSPDTVYAAANPPLRSVDAGSTWSATGTTLFGWKPYCVRASPLTPGRVWVGGENFIFAPTLHISVDGGETWDSWWSRVPGAENAVRCLRIDPVEENRMYLGMEGMLVRTVDGGVSWEVVLPYLDCYFSDVEIDPQDRYRLVSTALWFGGTPLHPFYFASSDSGASWEKVENLAGPVGFMGEDIELRVEDGYTVALVGGIGVYQVDQPVTVGVPDPTGSGGEVRLLPPLRRAGSVVIRYELEDAGRPVRLVVTDLQGRRVWESQGPAGSPGLHEVPWRLENAAGAGVPNGIYFLYLETGSIRISQKVPVLPG